MDSLLAQREFAAYSTSHLAVLALFAVGAAGLVVLGRGQSPGAGRRFSKGFAIVMLAVEIGSQAYAVATFHIDHGLPLQLSDLAGFVAIYALWSHRQWAFWLLYYWGLTLSVQALVSPALEGPDFPSIEFQAFWWIHIMTVWAAIYLTWGLRMRPNWAGYRFTILVTVCWAAIMLVFNGIADTNYGFLDEKPGPGSLLNVLGPWPWYLVSEFLLVLAVWALLTWPWVRARVGTRT
jgi:hypothetical integral membrane protein (TIGR02206 family)